MAERIAAILFGILGVFAWIISILSFMEKGFLFHNAYIWASKQERERMDKTPYYRQAAVAFAIVGAVLLCMAAEIVLQTGWLWLGVGAGSAVLLVYAVASSKSEG